MFLIIGKQSKEFALLLTICASCIVAVVAGRFVEPVIGFINELQEIGSLNIAYISILLKVVGIGFLAEIAALICADAGNSTLGKTLQVLSSCVILWLSIPLLSSLLSLIQDILGDV